jgi:DnaJ-class molecular chaperone
MNPVADPYDILGVAPSASPAEIRRAYRRLALQFHPDRAGEDSTPIFQRIADAYAVLGNDDARAAFDRQRDIKLGEGGSNHQQPFRAPGADALRARLRAQGQLLARVSGLLADLIAEHKAEQQTDGVIDLFLTAAEAARGGVALIDLPWSLPCPTCGGIARSGGFWCLRCAQTGRTMERITVYCTVRPQSGDGTGVTIAPETSGATAPVQIRLRIRA